MNKIEFGDCRDTMRKWAAEGVKVQTCVTSPPYFGLRDYGHEGQIGLEQTPDQYIAAMVEVFRCVKDVLADDGTLWLNIGDSYYNTNPGSGGKCVLPGAGKAMREARYHNAKRDLSGTDLKPKDLIGIPWMLAFALRADGWYLRQDIIWHKPNPMPESVRDRCTKAHEYIFLLSKSDRYFFDSEAMKEPAVSGATGAAASFKRSGSKREQTIPGQGYGTHRPEREDVAYNQTRNRRSVWSVPVRPYKGAHFATFPPALIEPCILAGSRPNDIVLDPFMGSGTTAQVAMQHGRQYLGCELNPEYAPLQDQRISSAKPIESKQPELF
jgi:DNA modification methylase